MKEQRHKTIWAVILLAIFLSSSYLCFQFGSYHERKIKTALEERYNDSEWIWAKSGYNIEQLTKAKGYNGAAIGFGIIAGSSLVSLTFLVNSRF